MVKISSRRSFRWALVALLVIILAGGTAVALHVHSVHKAQKASGTIPTSKKSASSSKTKDKKTTDGQASGSSTSDKSQSTGSPAGTSAALVAPFGTFISNHKPGQNGSPTAEQSVCNTTPGATCDIQFTNGSITKSLGAQVVDGNGTTYWSWDIKGGTLAPGNWRVTAVVKLNGQTQTTSDPTPLEVQ